MATIGRGSNTRPGATVFCDPLSGEAHSFSELATDEPLDRAADQRDADPLQRQYLGVDAGQHLRHCVGPGNTVRAAPSITAAAGGVGKLAIARNFQISPLPGDL
jgi:hypothetical protein